MLIVAKFRTIVIGYWVIGYSVIGFSLRRNAFPKRIMSIVDGELFWKEAVRNESGD